LTLDLQVIPASLLTTEQADEISALCGRIFDCDYRQLMDLNPVRTHVLGYLDQQLVSHALWLDRPLRVGWGPWLNAAYVEGVATHPDVRERGYGGAVMRRMQEEISPYELAALSPAKPEWYRRLGWEQWQGPLFIEEECSVMPTPDEVVLICRTPHTGKLNLTASLTAPWRPFELW